MRFQVADFSQMTTNFYPTLTDNTLDTPITHASCNDIPDRNISPRKVAVKAAIWSLEEQCNNRGAFFILSFASRKNRHYNMNKVDMNEMVMKQI